MAPVIKVALGVLLGGLVLMGLGAIIAFGVLVFDDAPVRDSPTASEGRGSSDTEVPGAVLGLRLARANKAIARYCVKALGSEVGAEEAPSSRATAKALDGVDALEAAAREDPDRRLAGDDTVRDIVEMAIESARNGQCLEQEADRLEAALD
ncbi:MAG: hypothetical protein M3088_05560 [Actinomycetota bacterium]|nr:hypothetical protein [Actinomycetota bacterium]